MAQAPFRSILVPLDGSPFAEQALPWASETARRAGAMMQLALVHHPAPALATALEMPEIGAQLDEEARAREQSYLTAQVDRVRASWTVSLTCAACHRGVADNEVTDHAMFPQMADCLTCHPKIEAPFSCEKCHAPGDQLKPASHTATYVDHHSSGKANLDKQSCVICHGRKFQCLGCH